MDLLVGLDSATNQNVRRRGVDVVTAIEEVTNELLAPAPTNRLINLPEPPSPPSTQQFYRLVTPGVP